MVSGTQVASADTPAEATLGRSRRSTARWICVVLVGLLVAIATVVGARAVASGEGSDFHVVRLRAAAPAFDLADLRDTRSRIALWRFRGAPLVVNFWASWCVPCRREMKAFESIHRRLRGRVAIIGINTNDQRTAALAFAKRAGTGYPLAFDPDGAVALRYGVPGLPTTVFIDANGIMRERRLGEIARDDLERTIKKRLLR